RQTPIFSEKMEQSIFSKATLCGRPPSELNRDPNAALDAINARDLKPIGASTAAANSVDVTVVGITAPQAQGGNDAASMVPAPSTGAISIGANPDVMSLSSRLSQQSVHFDTALPRTPRWNHRFFL